MNERQHLLRRVNKLEYGKRYDLPTEVSVISRSPSATRQSLQTPEMLEETHGFASLPRGKFAIYRVQSLQKIICHFGLTSPTATAKTIKAFFKIACQQQSFSSSEPV